MLKFRNCIGLKGMKLVVVILFSSYKGITGGQMCVVLDNYIPAKQLYLIIVTTWGWAVNELARKQRHCHTDHCMEYSAAQHTNPK